MNMHSALTTFAQIQTFKDSGCIDKSGIPTLKCFEVVFNNVLILSAAFVVIILFAMLVIGSFKYLTSRGDPERTGAARKTIMYAILGLVLFMSSYLILNIIQLLLLGDPNDPDVPSLLKFEIPQFEPTAPGGPSGPIAPPGP